MCVCVHACVHVCVCTRVYSPGHVGGRFDGRVRRMGWSWAVGARATGMRGRGWMASGGPIPSSPIGGRFGRRSTGIWSVVSQNGWREGRVH